MALDDGGGEDLDSVGGKLGNVLRDAEKHPGRLQVIARLGVMPGQHVRVEQHQVGPHLRRNGNVVPRPLIWSSTFFLEVISILRMTNLKKGKK